MDAPDQDGSAPNPAEGSVYDSADDATDEGELRVSVSDDGETWLNVRRCDDDYFKNSEVVER
jgi:hypothetical protein